MQGSTPVDCEVLNVIQGAGIWPDCEDKTQLLQAINTLISGGGSGGGNQDQFLHMRHIANDGVGGGVAVAGSRQTRTLNSNMLNTIPGSMFDPVANTFSLPAGRYIVDGWQTFAYVAKARIYLESTEGDAVSLIGGAAVYHNESLYASSCIPLGSQVITLSQPTTFEFRYRVALGGDATNQGYPMSFGEQEVYADLVVRKLA
ncbi:hypothetical protein [Thalassospira lucentensis]|uniref:Tail fiber protein n=1 Tax=Thalassospira lucentensis TaxID=168935 RepID=A0A358HWB2_9PROT|nr:hypothetical protein [Thalassospira lucentensis]HBU99084.1 hypothetical protein [Thalassospira lucentensis]HCW69988.1 hypothetical protein [Thalassospira lucentensis]|tara:strand:- start:654 stop:1259 length:606 start_codon:yes stop_codon:yes gene_type:complete